MKTQGETVVIIPLEKLHSFRNHPFKVRDDADMNNVMRSIREVGVLQQAIPSLSQAQRLKKLALLGELTQEDMYEILSEEKKQDVDRVVLKHDILKKYFPKSYTPRQMEETIIKLLEEWQQKRG